MKRWKIITIVVVALALLFFAFQFSWQGSNALTDWLKNNQGIPADQVPLTTAGDVDFLKMANDRLRKNVNVDNNIVVDLYQILPHQGQFGIPVSKEFVELLGNPPYDTPSPYISSGRVIKRIAANSGGVYMDSSELSEQMQRIRSEPWKAEDFPEFKAWLDENKPHLDKMVAASFKPYYYHPLCADGSEATPFIAALLSHAQEIREIARTLTSRAMNHLEEGRYDECLADLAAVRRLGTRMRQASTMIEHLVGIAVVSIAFEAESQVLSNANLTKEQCENYQKIIRETTTGGTLASCLQHGERVMMMDSIQFMSKGKDPVGGIIENGAISPLVGLSRFVDWRATIEQCDKFYTKLIDSASIEDDMQRAAAFVDIEEEVLQKERNATGVGMVMRMLAGAKSRGRTMGDILTSLLAPAMQQIDAAHVRSKMQEIAVIGFELEIFRSENGTYPKSLDELPQDVVGPLMTDRFSGRPITYMPIENGYRLFSQGANRKNDSFNSDGSEKPAERSGDDIVISVQREK